MQMLELTECKPDSGRACQRWRTAARHRPGAGLRRSVSSQPAPARRILTGPVTQRLRTQPAPSREAAIGWSGAGRAVRGRGAGPAVRAVRTPRPHRGPLPSRSSPGCQVGPLPSPLGTQTRSPVHRALGHWDQGPQSWVVLSRVRADVREHCRPVSVDDSARTRPCSGALHPHPGSSPSEPPVDVSELSQWAPRSLCALLV